MNCKHSLDGLVWAVMIAQQQYFGQVGALFVECDTTGLRLNFGALPRNDAMAALVEHIDFATTSLSIWIHRVEGEPVDSEVKLSSNENILEAIGRRQ